jgi:para-nitrobenzyl esterase
LRGDIFWNCGARSSAIGLAAAGVPTYLYELAYPNWKSITRPDGVPFEAYCGGSRWSALTYLFHSEHPGDKTCNHKWLFSAEEQQLAKALRGYWARFARTGDPNGGNAVTWPKYDATTDQHLVLDATISTGTGLHKTNCDFWASLE